MVAALLIGLIFGALVYFVGSLFDPTADNRFAAIAGFVVFLLVFLSRSGLGV